MDVPCPLYRKGCPASSLFLLVQIPLAMEMCSATFYTISSSKRTRAGNIRQLHTAASYEWPGLLVLLLGRRLSVTLSDERLHS